MDNLNDKLNNKYVTHNWLKDNEYTHSIKNAFVGEVNNYCKRYPDGRIEITLSDDKPGYEVELTDRNLGFMQFYNCKDKLSIEKLNTLINIFND